MSCSIRIRCLKTCSLHGAPSKGFASSVSVMLLSIFWYSEESLKGLAPRSIVIRYLSEMDSVSGEVSPHSVALEGLYVARDSHVPQYCLVW